MRKKIIILGSTGSIGLTTVKLILKDKKNFEVVLLSANKNYKKLFSQAKILKCKNIIIFDNEKFHEAKNKYKNIRINIFNKTDDFIKNFNYKADYTMCSIAGLAGLEPTLSIIKISKNVAIANKESIICGWNLINKNLNKYKCNFIPIDSEHFSILSLIKNYKASQIETIYLTASGGPFLNLSKTKFNNITPVSAVKHPNWKMGKKISIDSATLMNKVFEIIEAQRIFQLPLSKFKILIHPSSYVHAAVKFHNGTTQFLVHDTSMVVPIFNSLYGDDNNRTLRTKKIDFNKINNLDFKQVDKSRFPLVNTLKDISNNISMFETVLVSANDYFVELFLKKKISYLDIYKNIKKIIKIKEFTRLKQIKPKNALEVIKLSKYVVLKIKSLSIVSKF